MSVQLSKKERVIEIHIRVAHGLTWVEYDTLKRNASAAKGDWRNDRPDFVPWFEVGKRFSSRDDGETYSIKDIILRVPELGSERPMGMREVLGVLGLVDDSFMVEFALCEMLGGFETAIRYALADPEVQNTLIPNSIAEGRILRTLTSFMLSRVRFVSDRQRLLQAFTSSSLITLENVIRAMQCDMGREDEQQALYQLEHLLVALGAERAKAK